MIKFTIKDDNQQFISIKTVQPASNDIIIKNLKKEYPSLQQLPMVFDDTEIIIPIVNGFFYGFSLNELRKYIKHIAIATISHFCVDVSEPSQRLWA